ncbi:hypothetical protein D6T64_01195 [Cryobacterium melibiosiphilum]|uniref:Uncharacterized protein n=1 Tax=Cryobacterium melibiosiphilum TaxID=995039 RepID=A0A3A5MNU0_9MICO|nr:hypothetical protein D6T64_01195 [Cryobacterium melibiosiphilum]
MQLERAKQFGLDDLGADASSDAGGVGEDQVSGRGADVIEHGAQAVTDELGGFAAVGLNEAFENGNVTTEMCRTCRIPPMIASA